MIYVIVPSGGCVGTGLFGSTYQRLLTAHALSSQIDYVQIIVVGDRSHDATEMTDAELMSDILVEIGVCRDSISQVPAGNTLAERLAYAVMFLGEDLIREPETNVVIVCERALMNSVRWTCFWGRWLDATKCLPFPRNVSIASCEKSELRVLDLQLHARARHFLQPIRYPREYHVP